jgi:hypothetical protein
MFFARGEHADIAQYYRASEFYAFAFVGGPCCPAIDFVIQNSEVNNV